MTQRGILNFLSFTVHLVATIGVIGAVWGAGWATFDTVVATYLAILGGVFSWALTYQALATGPE